MQARQLALSSGTISSSMLVAMCCVVHVLLITQLLVVEVVEEQMDVRSTCFYSSRAQKIGFTRS